MIRLFDTIKFFASNSDAPEKSRLAFWHSPTKYKSDAPELSTLRLLKKLKFSSDNSEAPEISKFAFLVSPIKFISDAPEEIILSSSAIIKLPFTSEAPDIWKVKFSVSNLSSKISLLPLAVILLRLEVWISTEIFMF